MPEQVLETLGAGVFDLLPSALLITDLEGRVVVANRAVGAAAGVASASLLGRGFGELFLDDHPTTDAALAMWRRSASTRPAGLTLDVTGGDPCRCVASGARIAGTDRILVRLEAREEAGRHFAYLSRELEVRDLRELRRRLQHAVRDLGRANRQLRSTNEELERYASMVSHDLRGPIAAIRSFATMLEDTDAALSNDEREMVAAIRRQSEQALTVAGALLELARAGSFDGVQAPVDSDRALEAALEQAAVDQHPGVEVNAGALPPAHVHEPHLRQVFVNLITNALRYRRPDAPLRIEISARVEADWVRFRVSDDGPGVSEEDRDRVFLPNVRGRHVADAVGTGMGLALCRRLVTGYGGTIELVSEPGRTGATFAFTLPAVPD